jgi:DNA ligase-1
LEFVALCDYFQKLENTTKRNRMTIILAKLFKKADVDEIDKICYFLSGKIAAEYKEIKLGVGEALIKSSISLAFKIDESVVEQEFQKQGDLGIVAEVLPDKYVKRCPIGVYKHTVKTIHKNLITIAETSGENRQKTVNKLMAAMLNSIEAIPRRYLIRLALGQMRLGVGEMTILDGLAECFLGSKDRRQPIEHAYNISSDIGYVAKILASSGIRGVKSIKVQINRPLRSQLTQRVESINEIKQKISSKEIAVEEKYDGERVQAHKDGRMVKLYSRRLSDVTHQFPETAENVVKYVKAESAILDGEAVAYDYTDKKYLPFQKMMKRRRKYDVEKYLDEIPVKYMVFDLIYLNGSSYQRRNYNERTGKLHQVLGDHKYIAKTGRVMTTEIDEIVEYF